MDGDQVWKNNSLIIKNNLTSAFANNGTLQKTASYKGAKLYLNQTQLRTSFHLRHGPWHKMKLSGPQVTMVGS